MSLSERSEQQRVVRHIYDAYDQKPGVGFPNVSDLGPAAGLSPAAASRLIDRCVQEKLAYLFANAAHPCVGLTAAGRAIARDEHREAELGAGWGADEGANVMRVSVQIVMA